jgi:hypothetical protein
VRARFQPENLPSRPLAVYAYDGDELVGGACGRTVGVWRWLTVDLMWVDEVRRGLGLGRSLLERLEDEARLHGCDSSKLNTWDFQAPAFYTRCGYVEYGREVDYPPGHTNFLLRKDLVGTCAGSHRFAGAAGYGASSGYFPVRPSPDDLPRTRRAIHGARWCRAQSTSSCSRRRNGATS